jgi:quercetin dioxygenase-like cupin family protein
VGRSSCNADPGTNGRGRKDRAVGRIYATHQKSSVFQPLRPALRRRHTGAMSEPGSRGQPDVLPPERGTDLPFIGSLRASASDTGGSFEVIEYKGPAVPPPHIHNEHDEIFYILEGRFSFVIGHANQEAGAGSLVWIPRGTRHGFNVQSGSRALLVTIPAGLEGFFKELGKGLTEGKTSDEIRAELADKYDSIPAPSKE